MKHFVVSNKKMNNNLIKYLPISSISTSRRQRGFRKLFIISEKASYKSVNIAIFLLKYTIKC